MTAPDPADEADVLIQDPPFPSVDPDAGLVIREPDRGEDGYWVGSPGAVWDSVTRTYYLTYRRRRPPGDDGGRGYLTVIARSRDGVEYDDVLAINQEQLDTASMERACLRRLGDQWALYLGYVDPSDNRWRIDIVTGDRVEKLDVANRRPVLTAETTGTEGVKDPYVVPVGPALLMFVSFAAATLTPDARADAHSTGDIYARGVGIAPTGLATSIDGRSFDWQGTVLEVGDGWDRYQSRLSTVIPANGHYLGLYDGSATSAGNYEERCGLALSFDLMSWIRLTPRRPLYESRYGTRSLRYVDAVTAGPRPLLYYEYARADGAHDLRVIPFA